MNKIYTFLAFLLLPLLSQAQYFQAYAEYQGNDIVFFLRPNPGGGNITTGWSDIEFFLRFPTGSPTFSYGAITINSTDFPGISVPNNGNNMQGSETGYTNTWFGTSYLPTAQQTYNDSQPYEVFRVTIDVDPSTIAFELVHNSFFFPTYLALGSHTGSDLSSTGGSNKFYGGAISCSCPAPSMNDMLTLATALPVELSDFKAEPLGNKDALLHWQTVSEVNTSHFEVQRSRDAKGWEWVGEHMAVGNSFDLNSYAFKDAEIFDANSSDQTFYYRLKIIDEDETYEYSPIRSVTFKGAALVKQSFRIFPNPASDYLHVEVPERGNYTLELYDLQGRRILTEQNSRILQLYTIPASTYVLRVLQNGRIYGTASTVVIQR